MHDDEEMILEVEEEHLKFDEVDLKLEDLEPSTLAGLETLERYLIADSKVSTKATRIALMKFIEHERRMLAR